MEPKKILASVQKISSRIREFRRHIHANPELSFKEHTTSDYIAEVLESENIRFRRIAGTGILARIEGAGNSKNAVVLRADIDALPVCEATGLDYVSRNDGVMHACGHDMHTAALLGALIFLNSLRGEFSGTVFGLFQPGEEVCPGGASLVLAENPFDGYRINAFIAQHTEPDLPTGVFGIRPGKYMASGDEVRITVTGRGGHGAMPDRLLDPVPAAAAIITALQQIASRNAPPAVTTVLSIGRVVADGATNVIPNEVYMEGTLRTFDEAWRAEAKKRITEIASLTAAAYGVSARTEITDGYPCVVNSTTLTARAEQILKSISRSGEVVALDIRTTAEDFGYYTQLYPSVFYRFGVAPADGPPVGRLHTSAFNPDESALDYAAAALAALAVGLSED